MDIKTGIHEPTVTIPIGMDCRGLRTTKGWEIYWNWRMDALHKMRGE